MKTELDNKYLILKWDDITEYLNNTEKRRLSMIIDKVAINRAKHSKDPDKRYAVVSDTMRIFKTVTKEILDEINGVEPNEALKIAKAAIKRRKDAKDKS